MWKFRAENSPSDVVKSSVNTTRVRRGPRTPALTALAAWFLESVLIVLGMVLLMACWAVFIMVAR